MGSKRNTVAAEGGKTELIDLKKSSRQADDNENSGN